MATKSNEEELAQKMWARGKTEEQIAAILDIGIFKVHEYLGRPF